MAIAEAEKRRDAVVAAADDGDHQAAADPARARMKASAVSPAQALGEACEGAEQRAATIHDAVLAKRKGLRGPGQWLGGRQTRLYARRYSG